MRIRVSKPIVIAALTFPALNGIAPAQSAPCSDATLQGTYAFTLHGEHLGINLGGGPHGGAGFYSFDPPEPIDGVAIVNFDGAGNLTQSDFVIMNGSKRPGQTDPTTGFDSGETGQYTVFPDCTGSFEVDFPPAASPPSHGTFFTVRFVTTPKGATVNGVINSFQVADGTMIQALTCNIAAGCHVSTQTHTDGTQK